MANWKASLPAPPVRWRKPGLFAVSVGLHAGLLGLLSLGALGIDLPEAQPEAPILYVEIEPRPLLEGERVREPEYAPPVTETAPATATSRRRVAKPRTTPQPDAEEENTPTVPVPRSVTPAASPEAEPWVFRPETQGAAAGRVLRTSPAGCRTMRSQLSPAELALCDERFNTVEGPPREIGPRNRSPSEERRDRQFERDGQRALAQYEGRRRPLGAGTGVIHGGECPGSNLGVGCAGAHLPSVPGIDMRQGARGTLNDSQRSRLRGD